MSIDDLHVGQRYWRNGRLVRVVSIQKVSSCAAKVRYITNNGIGRTARVFLDGTCGFTGGAR